MGPAQKNRANALLSIFENAHSEPQYGVAEELGDGRGITFGRAGFTTGTGSGLLVVQRYVELAPENNTMAEYLPALERNDRWTRGLEPAPVPRASGTGSALGQPLGGIGAPSDDLEGLDGFAEAVREAGEDPAFQQAQDETLEVMYFRVSQRVAKTLGLRSALSKAQLYDAWVQHGMGDPEANHDLFGQSANGIAEWVNKKLGGYPLTGLNERLWLTTYLARRRWVLTHTDATWEASASRVDVFRYLLEGGAMGLDKPVMLSWEKCRVDAAGVSHRGPCTNQDPDMYKIGGVVFGDFYIE